MTRTVLFAAIDFRSIATYVCLHMRYHKMFRPLFIVYSKSCPVKNHDSHQVSGRLSTCRPTHCRDSSLDVSSLHSKVSAYSRCSLTHDLGGTSSDPSMLDTGQVFVWGFVVARFNCAIDTTEVSSFVVPPTTVTWTKDRFTMALFAFLVSYWQPRCTRRGLSLRS
jgi:hypothetical protein